VGLLTWEFDFSDLTAQMSDAVKGGLPNLCNISPGVFNGVMQSTTDASNEVSRLQLPGTQRDIMIAQGIRAAPATGDPVFCCKSSHSGFHVVEDSGAITLNAIFGGWDASDMSGYDKPWGVLLYPYGYNYAVANTSTTDTVDNLAASTAGGFMMYQITECDIVGTISVQSAANNDDLEFATLSGCTLAITAASTYIAGIVPTTLVTTPVGRYLRWQLAITSGTVLHFALAFVRG